MSEKKGMIVVGSGGHARVIISTCRAAGIPVVAVYDDNSSRWGKTLDGVPIVGPVGEIRQQPGHPVIIGIGDARLRRCVARKLDVSWGTLVHPHSFVDPSVELGPGSVVFAGAVIQPESRVGEHAIINTSASLDHNCIVEDFVQIAPGANLCGNVTVKAGTFVGANSVVLENLKLGQWSVIGAGAVVIRELPDEVVAVGCPARIIKSHERCKDNGRIKKVGSLMPEGRVQTAIRENIARILADSGRPSRAVEANSSLTGDLALDSLDLAVLVVGLEQELHVDPFREGAAPVQTVGQLAALYEKALQG